MQKGVSYCWDTSNSMPMSNGYHECADFDITAEHPVYFKFSVDCPGASVIVELTDITYNNDPNHIPCGGIFGTPSDGLSITIISDSGSFCDYTQNDYIVCQLMNGCEHDPSNNSWSITLQSLPENQDYYILLDGGIYNSIEGEVGGNVSGNITIYDFPPPTIEGMVVTDPIVCDETTGGITPQVTGGIPPYSFYWDNGASTDSIYTDAPPGWHYVTVTPSMGCSVVDSIFLEDYPIVPLMASTLPSLIDLNANNPFSFIYGEALGGISPYAFLWSTGETASQILIDEEGTYSLTVTDNDGCTASTSITVTESYPDVFVDHTATGNNDGSSWANAFTDLQDALALGADHRVNIAEGTYYPTNGTLRGISFEVSNQVRINGGYPNGGGERDPAMYETILSGNIDGVSGYAGNSYHVVSVKNVSGVILDGFTIRDGNADDASTFARARGGGIYLKDAFDTRFINCTLKWNKAIYGAGAFITLSPLTRFIDCTVKKNTGDYGSAMYHSNVSTLILERTWVIENNSLVRCAIESNNSNYTKIDNSIIANNTSTNANALGVIATNRNSSVHIFNSTILGADSDRYLITLQVGYGDQLNIDLINSIVAHQDPNFTKNVKAFNNGVLDFDSDNCYFQGNAVIGNASNNLYSDIDGPLQLNTDYSLISCTVGVDDGTSYSGISQSDIEGNPRWVGSPDIGAYESQASCKGSLETKKKPEETEIVVYPNPTKNILRVRTEIKNPTFHLIDIMGRKLITTQEKEIDVSEFPNGIYFLNVFDENQAIKTIRIIKQ